MHIKHSPARLLESITIQIQYNRPMLRSDDQAICNCYNPGLGRLAAETLTCWCKIQGSQDAICLPGWMWTAGEAPLTVLLEGQNHIGLGQIRGKKRSRKSFPNSFVAIHVIVNLHEILATIHIFNPMALILQA